MAQIASVAAITGTGKAFAVNEQGISRELKAGDVLQKGETIRTVGDVRVELVMDDGRLLAVAPNQVLRLDENVTESDQRPTAQDSAVTSPAAATDAVIQALERGTDLSTQLEATAAGLGGGAGADGGSTFVQLLRITEGVEPLSYNYTYTAPDLAPDLQGNPDVIINTPPTILVGDGGLVADNAVADVYEPALEGGSNAAGLGEFVQGKFLVSDPEGVASLVSVTINGQVIPMGSLVGSEVPGANGILTITSFDPATGLATFEYKLTGPTTDVPGQPETEIFSFTTTDGELTSNTATITLTIVDDAPVVAADTDSVIEGGTATGNVITDASAGDAGDSDTGADKPGADGWNSNIVVGVVAGNTIVDTENANVGVQIDGNYGKLTLNADGSYTYASTANAITGNEQDVFVYTVKDADGDLKSTTLTINLANVSAEPGLTEGTVNESGLAASALIPADGTLASGDGEKIVDGTLNLQSGWSVQAAQSGSTSLGTWSVNTNGTFSYTLTDNTTDLAGAETDSFSYTAKDANGNSVTNSVTITIVDDAPVVAADTDSVIEGGTATGNVITDASAGDAGDSDTGADKPGADGWNSNIVVGVVAGNTIVDTENANVGVQIDGNYGKLTLNADGSYTYASTANAITGNEQDVFVYTVKDADGDLKSTTLTINLANVSAEPGLTEGTVNESGLAASALIPADGTLASGDGEKIVDGTLNLQSGWSVQAAQSGSTSLGTWSVNTNGTFSYTLTDNTTDLAGAETDSFSYTAKDANGNSVTNSVTITIVDDAPVVAADTDSVIEGGTATGNVITDASAGDAGDSDTGADKPGADGWNSNIVVGVVAGNTIVDTENANVGVQIDGNYGKLTLNADGSYTYASTANAITGNEQDVFVYTVKDADGDLKSTTLTINLADSGLIAPADSDVIVNEASLDTAITGADLAAGTITGSLGTGSASETDATNQLNATGGVGTLTYTAATMIGTYGTIQINTNGSYIYTLTSAHDDDGAGTSTHDGTNTVTGLESFSYTVTDANGNSTTGSITVSIIDDVPTAVLDSANVNEGALLEVPVGTGILSNDTVGADGAAIVGVRAAEADTTTAVTNGVMTVATTLGTLTVAANGSYSYQSNPNTISEATTDTFVYTIRDGDGDLTTTTLTINLANVNPVPGVTTGIVTEAGLAASALVPADGTAVADDGEKIVDGALNLQSGWTVQAAQSGTTSFGTWSVDTDGTFNYTLIDNTTDVNQGATPETDSFSYTAEDGNGNSVTNTVNITIVDDVPTITATTAVADSLTLTTQDADTIGAATDTATPSANFATAFETAANTDRNYGADGAGTTVVSGYTLNVTGLGGAVTSVNSGLDSNGLDVMLTKAVNGDVVGSTTAGEVFRISVSSTGTVTLTQSAELDHVGTGNDSQIALATSLVTLSATATVTDGDTDTATATYSLDLGGNIRFDDDLPTITATTAVADSLTLTTQDADTIGAATDTATPSANFATAFETAANTDRNYGADGAGTTVVSGYTLNVTGLGGAVTSVNSGLDSNGLDVMLTKAVNGDVVGSTTAGEVFRISVSSTGTVTLTQSAELDHVGTGNDSQIALATSLVTLSATATVTDGDTDTATATYSLDLGGNIRFDDDLPTITATTAVADSLTLTTQDADTIGAATDTATPSANFATAFETAANTDRNYGADGAGTTVVSGYTLNVTGLGGAVTSVNSGLDSNGLDVMLTKAVNGDVVGSTTAGEVFRISVSSTGTVTLTQSAELDHVGTGNDSQIALATSLVTLSATATVTDGDTDTATATYSLDLGGNIRFDDDVPSILSSSSLITSTGTAAPETGNFSYKLGADTLTYSGSTVHDFVNMSLAGKVAGLAITATSVTPGSESATSASYSFNFTYQNSPTTTAPASVTLTFDKVAGTYTAALTSPLQYSQILTTSGTLEKFAYAHENDPATSSTNSPDVVVSKLSSDFFVQFSGYDGSLKGGTDDTILEPNEVITGATTWVSVSNAANGVAGDTLQKGEMIDMDFFSGNPGSNLGVTPTAKLTGMFMKFDNVGNGEDLVVVLKLVDADNNRVTKTLIIGAEDIYTSATNVPAGYAISLDQNDGAVIIENNDFNNTGEQWFIEGAQVITSTENLSGSNAYNLNGVTGTSGGSNFTSVPFGGASDPTDDNDVIKITDIGFVTTATLAPIADLNFSFEVRDADLDTTATQTLNAMFINGEIYQGTSGPDAHVGTANSDLLDGGLGSDTLTGGMGSDVFKWSLGETGTDTIVDFKMAPAASGGDVLDLKDLLSNEHSGGVNNLSQYLHFGVDVGSGKVVLSIDHDGSGTFTADQTIKFDNYSSLSSLQADLGAASTSDADIIAKMIANGNLKTDI